MITYELAKELKDAGFPQAAEKNGSYYALPFGYTFMKEEWRIDLEQPEIPAKIPTLSELIEALRNTQIKFWRDANNMWSAWQDGYEEYGETPEEAAARLWFALNKK